MLLPPVVCNVKGSNVNQVRRVIRAALADMGETRFKFDSGLTARVGKHWKLNVSKEKGLWPPLQKLAKDKNYELRYDTEGFATLRKGRASGTAFKFDDNTVVNIQSVNISIGESANTALVYETDPKSNKPKLVLKYVLPPSHPMSPQSLGRNGVPRVIAVRYEFDHNVGIAQAKRKAQQLLDQASIDATDVAFDSLLVPHISLGDQCKVVTDHGITSFRMRKFTLPLMGHDTMSVGYNKKVHEKYRRRKVKRKTKK